jgi:hypothetical protein
LRTCVKRKQCFGHGACDEPSCPDRSAQNDLLLPALGHSSLLSLLITGKKQAAGSRRRSPGTHLVLSWSCIQSRWGAADRGHEKTRRGFPPGAHFVSFNFANTPICTTRSTLFFSAAGANSSGNIFRLVLDAGIRRRSIMLSDPSKSPVRRPAYFTASDACVPDAVQREARKGFTPVFAGYAERCSADPGPFQTPSLERSGLKAGTRVERSETNVRITTLSMTVRGDSVPLFEPCT